MSFLYLLHLVIIECSNWLSGALPAILGASTQLGIWSRAQGLYYGCLSVLLSIPMSVYLFATLHVPDSFSSLTFMLLRLHTLCTLRMPTLSSHKQNLLTSHMNGARDSAATIKLVSPRTKLCVSCSVLSIATLSDKTLPFVVFIM